jgi:transcriptional regulator of arginine metabolism
MKNSRHKKILELIERYDIDTQESLIKRLNDEGFSVTQTTVSRDIKQLNLIKGITEMGTYKYTAPTTVKGDKTPVPTSAITEAVLSVEAAQNIVVVKTFPGMANAVAVCIDSLKHERIIGTVAGDDTILLVVKDNETAGHLENELASVFTRKNN